MAALGVRKLGGFNRKVIDAIKMKNPIRDPLFEPDPLSEEEQTPPVLEHTSAARSPLHSCR